MNDAVIIAATTKCIEGALGGVRSVPVGLLSPQGYDGLSDEAQGLRVRVKARYDVKRWFVQRTDFVGPETADRAVMRIKATILFSFTTEHETREDQRLAVRASCLAAVERARQALCYPGNVATDGTTATGIISGCWRAQDPSAVTREDWAKRIVQYELPITCLVLQTQYASWTPLSLPNLSLWLNENGQTTSGTDITQVANYGKFLAPPFVPFEGVTVYPQTTTVNGLAALQFAAGTNARMWSGADMVNLIGASDFYEAFAFETGTVTTNNAQPFDNQALFADRGSNHGVFLKNNGSQISVVGYAYAGADVPVTIPVSAGRHTVELWHDGTNLNLRIDGTTADAAPCAPISNLYRQPMIGTSYAPASSGYFAGKLCEIVISKTNLSAADRDACAAYLTTKWSI
jgi:hypothetical protein